MSVPLPSASLPIVSPSPAKPKTRPTAIPGSTKDASSGAKDGHGLGQSPGSFSFRRGSRSGGVGGGGQLGSSPAEGNWRERGASLKAKGPERTVGGFGDKKAAGGGSGAGAGAGAGAAATAGAGEGEKKKEATDKGDKEKAKGQEKKEDKEGGDKEKTGLSHVPCRFFKAGACTAGDSCQFSHEEGGKKEMCQWFLKGSCRFGHKCALAHVRPGEPISMDRKNKKAAQLESRAEKAKELPSSGSIDAGLGSSPSTSTSAIASAAPVPIRSALSSSMQSPQPQRLSSSPMREPFGPPSNVPAGSPSAAGFLGRSPAGAFGASPNRPSPLSASFSARLAVPSSLSLKSNATTSAIPATTGGGFSSSFSHSSLADNAGPIAPPLSASFADGAASSLHRSIWARSASGSGGLGENLSPRRMVSNSLRHPDVFEDDDEDGDHDNAAGEDLIPGSLTELLTPREMARRLSRRDSNESYGHGSPRPSPGLGAGPGAIGSSLPSAGWTGERLAQSAGAAMGAGFLGSLWAADGSDGRKSAAVGGGAPAQTGAQIQVQPARMDGAVANGVPPSARLSLLSQRAPVSPLRNNATSESNSPTSPIPNGAPAAPTLTFGTATALPVNSATGGQDNNRLSPAPAYFTRATDPSSPSARALHDHAPGKSLPPGVATALSRLHLQSPTLGGAQTKAKAEAEQVGGAKGEEQGVRKEEEDGEETMFDMDH